MNVSIKHLTRYTYGERVQFTPHRLLLRPRESPTLRVLSCNLKVEPVAKMRWVIDAYENQIAVAYFEEQSNEICIEANIVASVKTGDPFDFILEPHALSYPFSYNPHERKALTPYLEVGSPGNCAQVLPWVWREFPVMPESTLDVLTQINQRLHERIQYQRRDEEGVQSPDQTLQLGTGSCRDYARLFIEICRQLGFAARFVSGYLYVPPTGTDHFENVADGSMHAWTEVHIPGAGWKGFDPTNGILANNYFIPCAVANEPKLTSPVQGSYYHEQLRIPSKMEVELVVEKEAPVPATS